MHCIRSCELPSGWTSSKAGSLVRSIATRNRIIPYPSVLPLILTISSLAARLPESS